MKACPTAQMRPVEAMHTGLMIYLGDNWPDEYRNALFTANFHGRRLNMDTIQREGNSYVGHHAADFMKTSDPWFRGVELIYGPDGGVYLLDWSDIGECHEDDGIHRTSGRIFKLTYGTPQKPKIGDLSELTNPELIALFSHRNEWYVRQARRLLQERAWGGMKQEIVEELLSSYAATAGTSGNTQLRMMWAIYSAGGATEGWLLEQTDDKNEHVRSWAVRLLADGLQPISEQTASRFVQMAKSDSSGLVRLYLASSLVRLGPADCFALAHPLCDHDSDAADRVQPHLIWFGIEPATILQPLEALKLARSTKLPLIRENIVRRLTGHFANQNVDDQRSSDSVANPDSQSFPVEVSGLVEITRWLAEESDPAARLDILNGISAALNGWENAPAPENWAAVSDKLLANADATTKDKLDEINVVFRSGRALSDLKQLAADPSADTAARRKAIELLGPKLDSAELFDLLKSLINDKSIATQVAKSLVHCENPQAARIILGRFQHLQPDGKAAAINTLVSRRDWAAKLLDAIDQGAVPRSQVSAWHARQVKNFDDMQLSDQLKKIWGEVRESSQEKSKQMAKIKDLVYVSLAKPVELANGRKLYEKHCSSCHIIFGKGGKIGPDLTGSDRKNLSYLTENMVDPSASVAEGYRTTIFQLEDGRLLSGVVVEQNDRTVKLQTKDDLITIDRDTIEEAKKTKLSLMPDGLLDQLSEQEIVELFRFLMSNGSR